MNDSKNNIYNGPFLESFSYNKSWFISYKRTVYVPSPREPFYLIFIIQQTKPV